MLAGESPPAQQRMYSILLRKREREGGVQAECVQALLVADRSRRQLACRSESRHESFEVLFHGLAEQNPPEQRLSLKTGRDYAEGRVLGKMGVP